MTEIGILKFMYIKKWSRMAALDDYFFATFIGLSNTLFVFLNSSISFGMGVFENYENYEILSGNKPSLTTSDFENIEKCIFW